MASPAAAGGGGKWAGGGVGRLGGGTAGAGGTAAGAPAGGTLLRSSATVATPPVALPLPALAPGLQTKNVSKSGPTSVLGACAADRGVWSSTAKWIAGNLAWQGQSTNGSDIWDQRHNRDVATVALDAMFAQYGR